MNDDKSGTIAPVPQGNATAAEVFLSRHISDNPHLKFGPFPQRASNIQARRNDTEMDNNNGAREYYTCAGNICADENSGQK
jgi:hypothetical protein